MASFYRFKSLGQLRNMLIFTFNNRTALMDFEKCIELSKMFVPTLHEEGHEKILRQSLENPLRSFVTTVLALNAVTQKAVENGDHKLLDGIDIGLVVGLKMAYLAFKDPNSFDKVLTEETP